MKNSSLKNALLCKLTNTTTVFSEMHSREGLHLYLLEAAKYSPGSKCSCSLSPSDAHNSSPSASHVKVSVSLAIIRR